jgi:hypothetical protein
MRAAVLLAQEVGTGLGRGKILLRPLPAEALNPARIHYRYTIITPQGSTDVELSLFDDNMSLILLELIFFR